MFNWFLAAIGTLLLLFSQLCYSQPIKDSVVSVTMLSFSYAYQLPGGDYAKRFGNSPNIGAGSLYKTAANFIFGGEANFQFGSEVKETNMLRFITTPSGSLISQEGTLGDYLFSQRAFMLRGQAGKLFRAKRPNPNSGVVVMLGIGYMRHKILIDVREDELPQVNKEMKKGYDRLSDGFMLSQFFGYMYLDPKKYINFYVGIELIQGLTQNRRSWNYDTNSKDERTRRDLLYGFKVGFIIPIYGGKTSQRHYY